MDFDKIVFERHEVELVRELTSFDPWLGNIKSLAVHEWLPHQI